MRLIANSIYLSVLVMFGILLVKHHPPIFFGYLSFGGFLLIYFLLWLFHPIYESEHDNESRNKLMETINNDKSGKLALYIFMIFVFVFSPLFYAFFCISCTFNILTFGRDSG